MTSTTGCRNGSRNESRFDATHWRGRVCRFEGSEYVPGPGNQWRTFDRIEAGESASYSEFTADADGQYFLSDFLSGSDYSGSTVERANYRVFLEDFEDRDGVHEVYGGNGTYAIAVRIDAIDDEVAAVFDGLEGYPLISEEAHSELELEAQEEAWDSWAESDFVRELESRFGEDFAELVFVPCTEPIGQAGPAESPYQSPYASPYASPYSCRAVSRSRFQCRAVSSVKWKRTRLFGGFSAVNRVGGSA